MKSVIRGKKEEERRGGANIYDCPDFSWSATLLRDFCEDNAEMALPPVDELCVSSTVNCARAFIKKFDAHFVMEMNFT